MADLGLPAGFESLAEHDRLITVLIEGLEQTEEDLSAALETADKLAQETTSHLLEAGGKRVRPLLTMLAGMLADPQVATGEVAEVSEKVRTVAVALELTHLATLYHDDVMDEADQRRGVPAAHIQWSNSVAILAGDLIVARASRKMAELDLESTKIHTQTFEELVMGQLWETVGPQPGEDPLEHYLKVISGKTASLISAAAQLGARQGGSDEVTTSMMAEYGHSVGMAFQLADDIIDLTTPSESSGKVQGTDLKERVPTLPTLLLRRAAANGDTRALAAVGLIDGSLNTDDQLKAAVDAVCAHPVVEQAWAMTRDWAQQAIEAIQPLPESPVKTALEAFAHYVVDRDS